jgi:hypothetical protein
MSKPKAKSRSPHKAANHRALKSTKDSRIEVAPVSRRAATKRDRVLALLRAKSGTTIEAIANATGWQPHSVRGFLAGVVKKKLGLDLSSEKTDAGQIYRIVGTKGASNEAEQTRA